MITKIYPEDYSHIDSLTIGGVKLESSYNSNYYIHRKNWSIIFEDFTDDEGASYDQVIIKNGEKTRKYLGCDYGQDSIFERKPGDYGLYKDGNGYYVELDTTIC